ncbi:FHA domain-containing protein [Variovorax sp. J22R133]|uniref:FHA domain-containing protein n=1 Tax=Variovorax brevis TaxID=3053503 RepID=UPI002578EFF0|nr:FHA domain-containing protein [Variovorax sp. J22R133]MDM0115919.1 FHA domain-containing protein [Variovorax sp. J22R133]
MPKLIMPTANGGVRQVLLHENENTLGRGAQNDIVIDSNSASRAHALIVVEPAFVTIQDLGSSNGTFVNGERVESQVLADGDTIRIGAFEMRFVAANQEFTQVDAVRLATVPGLLADLDRGAATTRDTPTEQRGKR